VAEGLAGALLPLALAAAALGVLAPSAWLAGRSSWLLAALVLFTALGIAPEDLAVLRERRRTVIVLSVAPLLVLFPLAWALSLAFPQPLRDGVVALGLAPTEVASAGLVGLAAGDAALALGVVAGSLLAASLAGPVVAGLLGGGGASSGHLLGSFALAVLAPLAAGLALRAAIPRVGSLEPECSAGATLAVVALVYAALSGTDAGDIGLTLVAAGAFLALSAAGAAVVGSRLKGRRDRRTVPLVFALRDFAVAAALAEQAFGSDAAGVAGVYGVLMLVAGSAFTSVVRGRV
jgi:predicted Na+-dependent transporter